MGINGRYPATDLETRSGPKPIANEVPDEVIEYIAQQFVRNIRELEGALNRVLALAHLMSFPLTDANRAARPGRDACAQRQGDD